MNKEEESALDQIRAYLAKIAYAIEDVAEELKLLNQAQREALQKAKPSKKSPVDYY